MDLFALFCWSLKVSDSGFLMHNLVPAICSLDFYYFVFLIFDFWYCIDLLVWITHRLLLLTSRFFGFFSRS